LKDQAASIADRLFRDVQATIDFPKLARGEFEGLRQLKGWLTDNRSKRPGGYMQNDKHLSAYLFYYFSLHLAETYWVLEHSGLPSAGTGDKKPLRVLDIGAGPGTASLSLLLWNATQKTPRPVEFHLLDRSKKALAWAKKEIMSLAPNSKVVFYDEIWGHRTLKHLATIESFDVVLMSHFLNEFGNGPRHREPKQQLVEEASSLLAEEGRLVVIEPPLKEPTMDIMWLRDQIAFAGPAGELVVKAPCPQSRRGCPMLRDHLGWCYTQVPRSFARERGLAQLDRHIERAMDSQIRTMGFSYVVIARDAADSGEGRDWTIQISEGRPRAELLCEPSAQVGRSNRSAGRDESDAFHRGSYLDLEGKTPKYSARTK